MPQTVLLDRQGRIRAALSGEADWDGPEARGRFSMDEGRDCGECSCRHTIGMQRSRS